MGRTLKLVYPGRLPGMNEIITASRRNRYAEAKMRKEREANLIMAWANQGIGGFTFKGKAFATILFYEENRRRDEDNIMAAMKYIMDALKKAGIIQDDSQRYLHIEKVEVMVDTEKPRVEVILRGK